MPTQSKQLNNPPRPLNKDKFGSFKKVRKKDVAILTFILVVFSAADTYLMTYLFTHPFVWLWYYNYPMYITSIIFSILLLVFIDVLAIILFFRSKKNLDAGDGITYLVEEEKAYKVVHNFSSASNVVVEEEEKKYETTQEFDEYGNPIIYAEEIFDDEDDIFANEVLSSAIIKEKEKTYKDVLEGFDFALLQHGLKGDLGTHLLASMVFSPLIYVKAIRPYIEKLFKTLNNPKYIIHYRSETNIASEKLLYTSFEFAKANPDLPVFIYIDNIPSKEFLNYMRPLYAYIDNPSDDYYLASGGLTYYIPHNVYFLVDLAEGNEVYDISRRYLRYLSILNCSVSEVEEAADAKVFALSNKDLTNAKRNAHSGFALSEPAYKKLDVIFSLINEANGYVLQNKIQRKIEEYTSLLLSLGREEDDVIDEVLANAVIEAALITTEPQKLAKDYNVTRVIEEEFGEDKMKRTKSVIKEYLSLYGGKGVKKDD